PATVFMTTGNKPTPALAYPSMGSVAARMLPRAEGVPPYVSFGDIRGGLAGVAGDLGTAYNPVIIEGKRGHGQGRGGKGAPTLRVRGIQLPNGFTLDELNDRDKLLQGFDRTFRAVDKSADVVDGYDAFHKQALDMLRSDRTKKAFDLEEEKPDLRSRYG